MRKVYEEPIMEIKKITLTDIIVCSDTTTYNNNGQNYNGEEEQDPDGTTGDTDEFHWENPNDIVDELNNGN